MKKQLIIIFLLCLSVKGISQIPFDGSDSYATPPIGFGQSEFENDASKTFFLLSVSVIEWNMEI